ncbi:MAG: hypothetical protein D3919_15610, partial [Candidatus Electrothrix sp. AW5]|nr:hypothetical protein [Candidatus Electrothrix gigas]
GKVGIGTTSPGAKLAINGGVHVGGDSDPGDNNLVVDGKVGIGRTSSREKLAVNGNVKANKFIGDGSQLTNLSVGVNGLNLATTRGSKVGIGTTSPGAKLAVHGTSRTVAEFKTSSGGDAEVRITSGDSAEAFVSFNNSTTGSNQWMAGMDDDEQFKIAYGLAEITSSNNKLTIQPNGSIQIANHTPIIFQRYSKLGDNIKYNTHYNSNDYNAAIVGFRAIDGDIQENDDGDIIKIYMYIANNMWHIRADFRTHKDSETWYIDVMFVRKELSRRTGY